MTVTTKQVVAAVTLVAAAAGAGFAYLHSKEVQPPVSPEAEVTATINNAMRKASENLAKPCAAELLQKSRILLAGDVKCPAP